MPRQHSKSKDRLADGIACVGLSGPAKVVTGNLTRS
jgi:hypothetical protein